MSLDAGPSRELDPVLKQRILRSQNDVLSNFDVLMSSKLVFLEQKISSTQREISDSQFAKIQQNILLNGSYSFKRKGNEEQFKSKFRVLDKLREADSNLKDSLTTHYDESITVAKTKISAGIDILNHRQKLVKLADSSKLGWRVVQEYESHPLASDEEDEKSSSRTGGVSRGDHVLKTLHQLHHRQRRQPIHQVTTHEAANQEFVFFAVKSVTGVWSGQCCSRQNQLTEKRMHR